ncbi:MAG: acyl carrier protein [Bacilli bacterium]|jgi:acyl carrier protein|nr:acyl carrier protein [Bacilli bacterium]
MDDMLAKIEKAFAKTLKVDEVKPEAELRELGLDSLDLVELMMELEEEFGIEFSNDEMIEFKTVSDVYKSIEKKLNK